MLVAEGTLILRAVLAVGLLSPRRIGENAYLCLLAPCNLYASHVLQRDLSAP